MGWPLEGAFWTFLVALQNIIAVGVLLTLVYLFYRRLVLRPRRLTLDKTGLQILTMIFLVVSTEFLALAFEAKGLLPAARAAWLEWLAAAPATSPWRARAESHVRALPAPTPRPTGRIPALPPGG